METGIVVIGGGGMQYDLRDIELFCKLSPGAVAAYQIHGEASRYTIRCIAFSDGLARLMGFTYDGYAERSTVDIMSLVVEQDRRMLGDTIALAIRERREVDCSYRTTSGDGILHWMNVHGRFIGRIDDVPIFVTEFRDTTQETKVHEALLDTATNAIYVRDATTRELLYANQEALDFWGRGNDYFSRTCHEFFRGREKPCPWCSCEKLTDKPIEFERTDDPDHEGHIKVGCRKLLWFGRDAYCISYEDVTQQRKAEKSLRDIVDNIPAAIIVYQQKDGRIDLVRTNHTVEAIAGIETEQILDEGNVEGVRKHVHPEDVQTVLKGIEQMFSDIHESEFVYRNRPCEDSPYRWLHYHGRSFPQPDGTQLGYAVVSDISASMETKRSNDEMLDMISKLPVISLLMEFRDESDIRPISFSDGFCHMLGVTQEQAWELYGGNALASVHPDDVSLLTGYNRDNMHNESLQNIVHRFLRPDGDVVWVSCVFSFFRLQGRTYGYMVYTDITALKAEEAEFSRRYHEEQAYLDRFANSYLVVARANLTQNTVEMVSGTSPLAQLDIAGCSYDYLLSDCIAPVLARKADFDEMDEHFLRTKLIEAFKAGERKLTAEGQYRLSANGSPLWARVTVTLMHKPDSDDVACFIMATDIDDEKIDRQVFERMMSSDECDFVAIIDANRRTIDFRRIADSATTKPIDSVRSYDETCHINAEMYIREEERNEALSATSIETIVRRLENEPTYACTVNFIGQRGGFHRKLLRYSYLDREEGKVLAIRTDITEAYLNELAQTERLREALASAETANEAKSDFLSRMSHDIRTPLNGIIGMTDIAREHDNSPETDDCLMKIDTSSHFLLGLVNDILDLSKVESGKMELHPEPYLMSDFDGYIDSVIKPLYEEKNQHFLVTTTPVPTAIPIVDILRFNQIMFNLLSNAVKYTPEGGTISLDVMNELVEGHKERIIATIADNGVGMSEQFQKIIFDPFTQEGRNDSASNRGSGLGLSIVKRLVDLMGGTITVQSEVGVGTTFRIVIDFDYLDADQATWKDSVDIQDGADFRRLEGRHVLLCEDHPLNQEIAVHMLERHGMVVTCAEDGRLGLKAFADSPIGFYDAILMDIRMPVMDGFEATRAIRALKRADAAMVPIIAMTADAYDKDVRTCMDAGMNAHVAKPVDPDDLMRTLLTCVR